MAPAQRSLAISVEHRRTRTRIGPGRGSGLTPSVLPGSGWACLVDDLQQLGRAAPEPASFRSSP